LAYASGEEDFTDNNFNNVYDAGDTFTDLGNAFRDDDENGSYNSAIDGFTVPRTGSSACLKDGAPAPVNVITGRAGTCDGVWGAADVRAQGIIIFSTDDVTIAGASWQGAFVPSWSNQYVANQLNVSIYDGNGNSVPTGSVIEVEATDNSITLPTTGGATPTIGSCKVTGQSLDKVPNRLSALPFSVYLKECVSNDQVKITVTTSAGKFSAVFALP
jgi:hypothetical protein